MNKNVIKKGFTLIELLVVVLIIGILASVALPQYQKVVTKTKVVRLFPLIRAIDSAEAVYFMANGKYATDFDELDIGMPPGGTTISQTQLTYHDFNCHFQIGNASNMDSYSIYCDDSNTNSPWVEKYFSSSNALCWDHNNTFAATICKNITGKSSPDGKSSSNYYSIPW